MRYKFRKELKLITMYIGGLDVGTTGCKITLYNENGVFVHNEYKEYDVTRVNGEHEIDAASIYSAVYEVIKQTAKKYKDIAAIGVTTFGETFAMLDENDNVLLPSMLYTDPRGSDEIKELCSILGEDKLTYISGVKPHQMYSIAKIMWVKNNKPQIYDKVRHVLLMEDFIVYMLTGNAQIDYSLAARTMALDIRRKEWSKEILDAAGIDIGIMSKLVPTGSKAGGLKPEIAADLGLSENTFIINGCHDQVASAIGAGVFEVGQAVDGTGTCECVTPVFDTIPTNEALYNEGYSVVPFVFDGTYVCYALSFTGGAVLKWYRDNFAKYEAEAANKNGENVYAVLDAKIPEKPTDILVMPHFAGAANPYMDNDSRAVMVGLTLEHTGSDVYKALMEGITYEIMLNIEHLESFGIKLNSLVATGGGATSPVWLQIKADILNRNITSLAAGEAGACGTCMLAATAVGICKDLYDARSLFVKEKKTYIQNTDNVKLYDKRYKAYRKLYNTVNPIIKEYV